MNHQEYRRIVPGADMAVLMIHGIVGTPHHFDNLLPLIPENWSVVNLCWKATARARQSSALPPRNGGKAR